MLTILTVFILTFLNHWFQPENSRFEVRDCRNPWLQPKNVLTCAVAVMLQKSFRLASAVPRTSGAQVPYCKLEVHISTLPQPTFPHECAVSISCVFKSQYNRGCLRACWLQTVYEQGHARDARRERARSFPLPPYWLCIIYRNLK